MSTDLGVGQTRALCVRAVFRVTDDRHAQEVAARMIDCAHEIANLPECECDIEVSVELARDGHGSGSGDPAGAPAPGSPVEH